MCHSQPVVPKINSPLLPKNRGGIDICRYTILANPFFPDFPKNRHRKGASRRYSQPKIGITTLNLNIELKIKVLVKKLLLIQMKMGIMKII